MLCSPYRDSLKGGPQVLWERVKKLRCVFLLQAPGEKWHRNDIGTPTLLGWRSDVIWNRFTIREGRRKMWSTLPIYTVKKVGVRWPKHPFRLHLVRVKCPHLRILRLQSRFPACRTSRARRRSCAGCSTAATGWTSSTAARVKRSCFGRPVPQEPPPLCRGRAKKN